MSLFKRTKTKDEPIIDDSVAALQEKKAQLEAAIAEFEGNAIEEAPADDEVTRTVTREESLKSSVRLRALMDEMMDDPMEEIDLVEDDPSDSCDYDASAFVPIDDDIIDADDDDVEDAFCIDDEDILEAWLKRRFGNRNASRNVVDCLESSSRPWFEEAPGVYRTSGLFIGDEAEHPDLMNNVDMHLYVMPDGVSFTYDVNLHLRIPGTAKRCMEIRKDASRSEDTLVPDPRGFSVVRFCKWKSRNNRMAEFVVIDGEVHYKSRIPSILGSESYQMPPEDFSGYIDSTIIDCFERSSEIVTLLAGVKPWLIANDEDE